MAVLAGGASAQQQGSAYPSLGFSLGGAVQFGSTIDEFSEKLCPFGEVVTDGRISFRATDMIGFSLSAERHGETGIDLCINGLIPPPPDSGSVTRPYKDESRTRGSPYWATTLRTSIRQVVPAFGWFHAFGGVMWIWEKDILAPFLGAGFSIGASPVFF